MRPFAALPPRVLASLLATICIVALALVIFPAWTLFFACLFVLVSTIGALLVAQEASMRRQGRIPKPLSAPYSAALWTFACGSTFLCLLCAPDITAKDAGELAGAAFTLGVPHPTGFPFFCMFGKAHAFLPAGPIFFRITVSAGLAMAAAGAISGCLSGKSSSVVISLFALLCCAGPWLHAVNTEVYALSACGLSLTMLLGYLSVSKKDARFSALAWFLLGVGAGGHVTWPVEGALFLAVCTLLLAYRLSKKVLFHPLFAIPGLLVLAYLPVAASRDPLLNFGAPSSFSAFLEHVTGARIRQSFAGEIGNLNPYALLIRAKALSDILWDSTALLLPFTVLGFFVLLRERLWLALSLLLVAAADTTYALLINPMGIREFQTPVHLYVVLAIFTGACVFLLKHVKRPLLRKLGLLSLALSGTAQFLVTPVDRDFREVLATRMLAVDLLHKAPTLASVLTATDDLSSALLALQAVENARPDVLMLVRPHLADRKQASRWAERARATEADEKIINLLKSGSYPMDSTKAESVLLPLLLLRGNVLVELGEGDADSAIRRYLIPQFPAFLYTKEEPAPSKVQAAAREVLHEVYSFTHCADAFARSYLGAFVRLLGAHLAQVGFEEEALRVTEAALMFDRNDARTWHNLGILLAASGNLDKALTHIKKAVELDPAYVRAWRSLKKYAQISGDLVLVSLAEHWLEKLK